MSHTKTTANKSKVAYANKRISMSKTAAEHVGPHPLTFGELIAATYGACGARTAKKILQMAVNSELVTFPKGQRYSIV